MTTFFVASNGDDANSGSPFSPFATIQRAINEADESVTPGEDTIKVRSGDYVENLVIDDADPITIKGLGRVTIDGNNTGDTVNASGQKVTLRNLTIMNGSGDGIYANSQELHLRDVDSIGNSDDGLDVENSNTLTISHSHFNDNGGDGVEADFVANGTIKHSQANDNFFDGLDIGIGTLLVEHSESIGNGDEGMDANNIASLSINGGEFKDNGDDGIDLEDVVTAQLTSVTVRGNGDDGLDAFNGITTLNIDRGSYSDNGEEGIDVSGVNTLSIVKVTADDNVGEGFWIGSFLDVGTAQLTHLSASRNGLNGVRLGRDDSFAVGVITIDGGKFSHNGRWGVQITGGATSAVVEHVRATHNGNSGLFIDGSGVQTEVTVDGGSFSRNGVHGVQIVNVGNITLSRVKGSRNTENGLNIDSLGSAIDQFKLKFRSNSGDDIVINT